MRASRRFTPRHGLTGCDLTSHFLRPLTFRSAKHIAGTAKKTDTSQMLSSTVSTFCGASIAHRRPLHARRSNGAMPRGHAIAKLAPPVDAIDDDERAHMTRRSTLFAGAAASVLTNVAPRTPGPWRLAALLDFTLSGTDGNVTLSEALKSNEFVVLYFYNQDGSPGCSIEAQRFEAAIPRFT